MVEWTDELEKLLFDYVVAHTDRSMIIDWTELDEYMPNLSYSVCYAKYYRMKKDKQRWSFARAVHRKFARLDREEFDKHINSLIAFLSEM